MREDKSEANCRAMELMGSGTGCSGVVKRQRDRRRMVRRGWGGPGLHLTSMLDVTFLLLIFFVLTASFSVDEGILAGRLPRESVNDSAWYGPPVEPVIIELRAVGDDGVRIRVGSGESVGDDFGSLYGLMSRRQFDVDRNVDGVYERDCPIIIRSIGSVRWAHVTNAYNACIRAGYENVTFARAGSDGA